MKAGRGSQPIIGEKQRVNAFFSGDLRVLAEHDPYYTQRMATCFSLKQFQERGWLPRLFGGSQPIRGAPTPDS